MNRKFLIVFLSAAALGTFTPLTALAQEKKAKKASDKAPAKSAEDAANKTADAKPAEKGADATRAVPYQGKVASVDAAAKTFTIKTQAGKEHVFAITDKTAITKDEGAATFEDIKVGEVVRGTRTKKGEGQWEAVKVMIGPKEKEGGAANPAPEGDAKAGGAKKKS